MKKLIILFITAAFIYGCGSPPPPPDEKVEAVEAEPQPVEFGDSKYMEIGKAGIAAFSSGDIDKWMEQYTDDAVYVFNNGDSVVGKPAITAFWKKRRNEAIETITFSDDIWLPLKVNQPQTVEAPGNWVLGWYKVDVVYKNKKTMAQWIHSTIHFNDNDKIDRSIQYVDMASINAVSPMK